MNWFKTAQMKGQPYRDWCYPMVQDYVNKNYAELLEWAQRVRKSYKSQYEASDLLNRTVMYALQKAKNDCSPFQSYDHIKNYFNQVIWSGGPSHYYHNVGKQRSLPFEKNLPKNWYDKDVKHKITGDERIQDQPHERMMRQEPSEQDKAREALLEIGQEIKSSMPIYFAFWEFLITKAFNFAGQKINNMTQYLLENKRTNKVPANPKDAEKIVKELISFLQTMKREPGMVRLKVVRFLFDYFKRIHHNLQSLAPVWKKHPHYQKLINAQLDDHWKIACRNNFISF